MPDELEKALRYRWLIFGILSLSYVLVYFHRLAPAVVAEDMMEDLSAGGVLLGLLGSAYFYSYAFMQLPAGILSDSWGPRRTITLFFTVAFAGSVVLGYAPGVTVAIMGRTMVGLGVAMLFVPTMKVLAEWFTAKEFAGMTGILMAMGGVGSIAATSPLALMSRAVGWRLSFVMVGAGTAVLAAAVWSLVRDRPADFGWPSPAGARGDGGERISIGEGVRRVVSNPWFWPLAVWFFFEIAIFFSFGGLWGGPYLLQVYGMSKAQAGNVLMMLAIGLIVGSPMHGILSNRVFRARKPPLVISSFITLLVTMIFALYTDVLPVAALHLLCFCMGVFTSAIVVIGFTATKELFPVRIAGTSTGLVNLFPFLGGALAQPALGYILERGGRLPNGDFTVAAYRYTFYALSASALVALIASLFVKETLEKRADPAL